MRGIPKVAAAAVIVAMGMAGCGAGDGDVLTFVQSASEPDRSDGKDGARCPDSPGAGRGSRPPDPDDSRDANQRLAENVGREFPEFAGHYLGENEESLHVRVTEVTDRHRADCLQDALAAHHDDPWLGELPVEIERATFSWRELTAWNVQLRQGLGAQDSDAYGVVSFGIKPSLNRITIGIQDPQRHADALRERVAELGIPVEAVEIQQEDPVEPAVSE